MGVPRDFVVQGSITQSAAVMSSHKIVVRYVGINKQQVVVCNKVVADNKR